MLIFAQKLLSEDQKEQINQLKKLLHKFLIEKQDLEIPTNLHFYNSFYGFYLALKDYFKDIEDPIKTVKMKYFFDIIIKSIDRDPQLLFKSSSEFFLDLISILEAEEKIISEKFKKIESLLETLNKRFVTLKEQVNFRLSSSEYQKDLEGINNKIENLKNILKSRIIYLLDNFYLDDASKFLKSSIALIENLEQGMKDYPDPRSLINFINLEYLTLQKDILRFIDIFS